MKSKFFTNLKTLFLYGELFGGAPSNVKFESAKQNNNNIDEIDSQNQRMEAVQGEILYCPYLEFYAFDIAYQTDTVKRGNHSNFISTDISDFIFFFQITWISTIVFSSGKT